MFNRIMKYAQYGYQQAGVGLAKISKGTAFALAFLAVAAHSLSARAADTVTLPDMPIDFGDLATKGMVTVGVVLVSIAGIVVVVSLCMMGLRKLSGAFSGRA